jgi:gas vesicle protein
MWSKVKKEELIGIRVSKEFKAHLQKKAKEKGVSLTEVIEERLYDTFDSDKERIQFLISERKKQKPEFWKCIDQSPINREVEKHLVELYTEYMNPIGQNIDHLPLQLITFICLALNGTLKHFDSLKDDYKYNVARRYFDICSKIIDSFPNLKSNNKEEQEQIIHDMRDMAEKICYTMSAMAFNKDAYNTIKKKLDELQTELLKDLKQK